MIRAIKEPVLWLLIVVVDDFPIPPEWMTSFATATVLLRVSGVPIRLKSPNGILPSSRHCESVVEEPVRSGGCGPSTVHWH